MPKTPHNHFRCILSAEPTSTAGSEPFPHLAQARCGGCLPDDPLELYSLCLDCDLLHQQGDRSLFSRIASQLARYRQDSVSRQSVINKGCSGIAEMLERLTLGDPDARVYLPDDVDVFSKLAPLLNRMADSVKEQIDESHETAIGLCEHYETLIELAAGDLEIRARVDSPIELIAKLGELINRQAETFINVIRQQRTQEQELHSLNQRLQAIIDFLPDATFVIDAEHRVIAWNRAVEEMTGVSKEDMIGKGEYAYAIPFYGIRRPGLIDFIGKDLSSTDYNYKYFKRQGRTVIAEGPLPAGTDGSERYIWMTAAPLYNLAGQQIGAIESVRDITDVKKLEGERELLKEQLHHTQKLDSIGQLAGGIAHEFNNVLAAILGYASILKMRLGADSPHQMAVDRIISASETAAALTRGMLSFSRKQIMSLEHVNLTHLIAGMKEMLSSLAGENIHLELQLDRRDLLLLADSGQLQQIVLNLYNNARDAMPDGGRLTISTGRGEYTGNEPDLPVGIPAGSYVLLSVSDTGHGIAPHDMERIFDPFFSTKEVGKGTGLGLSMVFGIVQQHNGYIKVNSTLGQGTTFSIWFPECDGSRSLSAMAPSLDTTQPSQGSATILIGEDNENVRLMLVELLRDIGYQVLEARDGSEVAALMEDFGDSVDLLLLDVIMPRMNGQEALLSVRKKYPEIPCIFLSGYSDDILNQKSRILGEFEYLAKPIMPDRLIAAVREALAGRKARS